MTFQIINVFGKIVIMIGFGFFLRKRHIFSEEVKNNLSTFLMKAVLPMSILSSANQTYSAEGGKSMMAMLLLSAAYYIVSLLLMHVLFRRLFQKKMSMEKYVVFANLAVFANVGFIGFPLLGELLGDTGTLLTVAYNMMYQLFFFTYGIHLLKMEKKFSFASMKNNSILMISIISIALYFSGWRFPEMVQASFSSIGAMMVPISMMIIGYEIAGMKGKALVGDAWTFLVSAFRLVIFPAVLMLVLKLAGAERELAMAAVLLTALPSGSLTVIAAQDYHRDTAFAACAVAQSTLLMIIQLPVFTVLCHMIF